MEPRRHHQFDAFAQEDGAYNDEAAAEGSNHHPDYNDPATLAKLGGLATPATMTVEQLRIEARSLSQNIFASYDRLQAILARHETIIQKRWAKKKKQQKLELLEHAWPAMARTHRPDFALWRRSSSRQQTEAQTQSRQKHFMCPYINQEDLLKPKTLLLLLNARGRHSPADFAGTDLEAMHFGLVTHTLTPIFLNTYTMILIGAHNPDEYGQVISWDEIEEAFTWCIDGTQFMPGEGLLVLEAQDMIMNFLVTFCNKILHDIPPDILLTDSYPVEPEPLMKTEKETDGFDSMVVMALESPYRVPGRLDFVRIEALLCAKVESANDNLWQLREDPGYFYEQLYEIMEHRQEMLNDTYNQVHPARSSRFQNLFWTRVLCELVVSAYFEFEIFAELHKQALCLHQMHSKYEDGIFLTKKPPEEFLMALLRFRHYLNEAAKLNQSQLKRSVVASPPMRKFFVRTPPVDRTSSQIHVRSNLGVKKEKGEGELIWLLQTLWEDGHDLFLMRMPFVLDELQRLLEAEPRAKDLVSARIAAQIGSLSIISQCIRQLEMYQPWARGFENALPDREDALMDEFVKTTAPRGRLIQALHEKNEKLKQAAKPCESAETFAYPSTKRRTKETTEAMIAAERNLDKLWANVDMLVHADTESLKGMAVQQALSRELRVQRTSVWVEPAPTPKNQSESKDPDIESLYKPLSVLYYGHNSGTSETPAEVSQKAKSKRKGQAREAPASPIAVIPSPVVETQAKPIRVDARALKVFQTLFHDRAVTSTPGEVSWTDFTYALTSTGKFTAEKLYGSVWQFAMIDGPGQSRIQFHEPHPRGKVPFVIARRHGRRLNRAYGWTRDTFALK